MLILTSAHGLHSAGTNHSCLSWARSEQMVEKSLVVESKSSIQLVFSLYIPHVQFALCLNLAYSCSALPDAFIVFDIIELIL